MISWDEYNDDTVTQEPAVVLNTASNEAANKPSPEVVAAASKALAASELATTPAESTGELEMLASVEQTEITTDTESAPTVQSAVQPSLQPDTRSNVEKANDAVASIDIAPGLEELEMGAQRIEVDQKRMINCRADLNQLVPFKYDWAWQKYLDGCANHWMPQELT